MLDLSQWPTRHGARWATTTIKLPPDWERQFYSNIDIIKLACAENLSHAVILAVNEMAERLRANVRDD